MKTEVCRVVGVDLAGSPKRRTGLCFLEGRRVRTEVAFSDEEILGRIREFGPVLVAIDAPLSLPRGRRSLEEPGPHLRECDRALLRRGIRFFPVTLGPMRRLTERGMRMREVLEKEGHGVIEVYPGGAQDVLGLPRKGADLGGLVEGLRGLGLEGLGEGLTHDEADAVTAALVGALHLAGMCEPYGDPEEGQIVMPLPGARLRSSARPWVPAPPP